jgi:HAD superfamily hydrolase (TIGR01509 family)
MPDQLSPSLIIFDCDGTLVDSETLNLQAILDVIGTFGINDYDLDHAHAHFTGLRFSKIIQTISGETGVTFPEDAKLLYRSRVRELARSHLEPIEGAIEMVRKAAACAKICVASNGERGNVLYSLEKVGLLDFFEEKHVFTGLMIENPKPAPDIFELASKELNTAPAQCLVIEDSPTGVTAAVAANMNVWGFCGTHHAPEEQAAKLRTAGARCIHTHMNALQADLQKMTA